MYDHGDEHPIYLRVKTVQGFSCHNFVSVNILSGRSYNLKIGCILQLHFLRHLQLSGCGSHFPVPHSPVGCLMVERTGIRSNLFHGNLPYLRGGGDQHLSRTGPRRT